MIHKIIKGVTILLAVLLIGYIGFLKMPKASINSKDVVAELSAEELYSAFANNEKQAQDKYLGKAVIISGIIDDKYNDETGAPVIILRSKDGTPVALITLHSGEQSKLDRYKIDDLIRLKAQCSGLLMEVTLGKGLILEAE